MFETKDTKVCRGCLSSDRKLTTISANDLMLYYTLLAEDRKPNALTTPGIHLCWECKGILRRSQMFRAQVQQAHTILEDMLGLPPEKSTLSSLTIQHKSEYDAIFEETKPVDQPLFFKKKEPDDTVEKIVIPTKYKPLFTKKDKKDFKDGNSNLSKLNYNNDSEIDNMSDDSDHYDNFNTRDRDTSSPELTIKRISPQKISQDVKIFRHTNLNDEKSKIKSEPQYKVIRTNRVLKNNAKIVPIVKTPVIAKLEQELQKFMQNVKNNPKNATVVQNDTTKQKQPKKKPTDIKTNEGSSNDVTEIKNNSDRDDQDGLAKSRKKRNEISADESSSEEETSASNRDRKKPKRRKPESDPDFSVEEDESDSEYEGKIPKKAKLDDQGKLQTKRYKRMITRYKHIDEVLSCFTAVEMSMDDIKSTLEKEDAIVDAKKPIKCSVCGVVCKLSRHLHYHGLHWHRKTHPQQFRKGYFYNPPPTMPDEPRLWRCSICSKLLRKAHVLSHMNEYHRTQYYCNGDGCEWSMMGFWVKEELVAHWNEIHKQFVCDKCGVRRRSKSMLENHVQRAHLKIRAKPCPHCPQKYVLAKALEKHIQRRHSEPVPAEQRYCVECDITFPTTQRLQIHFYRKHSAAAKTKYPCGVCGRVLANKYHLKNHYDLFHAGKTKHRCHICGKYFAKKQAMINHVNMTHFKIKLPKTKPCPICGRMLQTNRSLRQHMYTHTGERPYKCTHCDAAYTQPYCLRTHLAKAHSRNEVVHVVPLTQ